MFPRWSIILQYCHVCPISPNRLPNRIAWNHSFFHASDGRRHCGRRAVGICRVPKRWREGTIYLRVVVAVLDADVCYSLYVCVASCQSCCCLLLHLYPMLDFALCSGHRLKWRNSSLDCFLVAQAGGDVGCREGVMWNLKIILKAVWLAKLETLKKLLLTFAFFPGFLYCRTRLLFSSDQIRVIRQLIPRGLVLLDRNHQRYACRCYGETSCGRNIPSANREMQTLRL